MPYSNANKRDMAERMPSEPTEKSTIGEKLALAIGYVSSTVTGVWFYNSKDKPSSVPENTWIASATGEMMSAGNKPNVDYWMPTILFAVCAVFTVCVKIRIWWRHY